MLEAEREKMKRITDNIREGVSPDMVIVENSRPWLFQKGQSGNPSGRPKGVTLKQYCRKFLMCMTEEEKQDFLDGMPKETIWRMAEGNPAQDLTSGGEKITVQPIYGGLSVPKHDGDEEDIPNVKEVESGSGGNVSEQNDLDSRLDN